MSKKRKRPLGRGPKGGKKHTPGRDHDSKSRRQKDRRREAKALKLRKEVHADALRTWAVWDSLSSAQKKLLDDLKPKMPRPDQHD